MQFNSEVLPGCIKSIVNVIEQNAEEVTVLDQVCGDGDHVINLQRGLDAVMQQNADLEGLGWAQAFQKIGMTLLSTMGGASGSLFGTLFISMSKAVENNKLLNLHDFANIFSQGVEAVKKRGKADAGEKTMLDVLIPVAEYMMRASDTPVEFAQYLKNICQTANEGVESTRNMLATKGRASYLGEKTIGHIDAGAKTSQLIICAIVAELERSKQPK